MTVNDEIQGNLISVTYSIDRAVADYERPAGSVQLIAVSKVQPIDRVRAAVLAGHRLFGLVVSNYNYACYFWRFDCLISRISSSTIYLYNILKCHLF